MGILATGATQAVLNVNLVTGLTPNDHSPKPGREFNLDRVNGNPVIFPATKR